MPNVVTDILAGPVRVLYAPIGTALPADTLAAGGTWPSWVEVGLTKEPLTMAYEYETEGFEVEQSLAPVARRKTSHMLSLETVLAEFSALNLSLSFDGVVTTVAAGVGQPGKEELDVGDTQTLTKRMWGFEGIYSDEDAASFPARLIVYIGTGTTGGELEWSKAGGYTGIPLKIEALSDMARAVNERLFYFVKILEPAT